MKIITWTIANIIKKIFPCVISEIQNAFIEKRLIIDVIIIAYEIFIHFKKTSNSKQEYVGIKMDMVKTYHILEWEVISNTLASMCFYICLTNTIMKCIIITFFHIDQWLPYRIFYPY